MKAAFVLACLLLGQVAFAKSSYDTKPSSSYGAADPYDPAKAPTAKGTYSGKEDSKHGLKNAISAKIGGHGKDSYAPTKDPKASGYGAPSKDSYGAPAKDSSYGKKDTKPAKPSDTYCFPQKLDKVSTDPKCGSGFNFDEKLGKCCQKGAYSCGHLKGSLVKDTYGKPACATCDWGYDFVAASGKCEKPCGKGYSETKIAGAKYCVKDCGHHETAVGQSCVDFEHAKKPRKCSESSCLFDDKLYFTQGSKGSYAPTPASPYATGDSYTAAAADCVCAKTKERDLYPKDCKAPKTQPAKQPLILAEPTCAGGYEPNHKGECPGVCPLGCSEGKDGKCLLPCPAGYQLCATKKGSFCAKTSVYAQQYAYSSYDACSVVSKMEKKLDESCICPAPLPSPRPSTRPSYPASPKPATKPATLPATVAPVKAPKL